MENEGIEDTSGSGNIFCIDHSKRGTAKCMECKKAISKGELRISKFVPYKAIHIQRFFHVKCAFEMFKRARIAENVVSDINQLDGLENLSEEEKNLILRFIFDGNEERTSPLPERSTRKEKSEKPKAPEKTRTRQVPYQNEGMKILFSNADQLSPSKKDELVTHIDNEKPLLIAISEINPKNGKVRDALDYNIPGYSMHVPMTDASSSGRGIIVYTHDSIEKSIVDIKPAISFNEVVLLEIRLRGGDRMIFGCFYRSPTISSTSKTNTDDLNKLLINLCAKKYSHVCFVGDFNFRDINWKSRTTPHNDDSIEYKFIETTQDCFLHQHIVKPTRKRGNDEASLLDLILTNEELQVSDIAFLAPLGKSDHSVISFRYNCYLDFAKPKERHNYKKADFAAMRDLLTRNGWVEQIISEGRSMTVDELWSKIKQTLDGLRNDFVPKCTTGEPSWCKRNSVPIGKPLRDLIRRKQACHRRWMSTQSADSRYEYNKVRNSVKRLMRQAKRSFERGISLNSKNNPKAVWAYVRQKMKTKTGVAPLLADVKDPESTKFDDNEKANILQKQFSSVFTREPDGEVPTMEAKTNVKIQGLTVTATSIKKLIKKLKVSKSCGPDEIHPRLLIELCDIISEPLSLLMNKTLEEGHIPDDWRNAFISAIFKKGARNRAENYRPISLTSIVCKLMESLIKEHVINHIIENNLVSLKQFGFISGRSTVTQLLHYMDICIENMLRGGVTDSIYLDFAKAFDTVPHRRLIEKLKAYGIDGDILKWIEAFLSNRSQVVKVNGETSSAASVLSGIPQGSVLGPLLFVLYINDLPEAVKSHVFLFADDTKVFRKIDSEIDSIQLQHDIDALDEWTSKWLLKFNSDKCHVLTMGKTEDIKHTHNYKIGHEELDHVFSEKDLGVTFDTDLEFEEHITSKVNKANAIMGLIRRSFSFLDKEFFKKLYVTFVRPHLEYAQSVWAPHLKKYVDMLEKVQIRATKLVDGFRNLTYEERLKELDLPTLVYRRARGDMIEVYKHLNVYHKETLPPRFQISRLKRNHDSQLIWNMPSDGSRGTQANSFYFRSIPMWNDLPRSAVDANSVNSFKSQLDDAWSEKPWKYEYNKSDS